MKLVPKNDVITIHDCVTTGQQCGNSFDVLNISIMTHSYKIEGLTCNGCVAKAKSALLKLGDVTGAEIQLDSRQAIISMQKHIPTSVLQKVLKEAGNYTITEADIGMKNNMPSEQHATWFKTYKPILLVGIYITGITTIVEIVNDSFILNRWMHNFMAAFFLTFSFFKLLDLKGFADNYSTYDIIAKRWSNWGYVYAFIELILGIAYLLRLNPFILSSITFIVMSVSIIGVLQSVLNKRTIRCACLGAVFNLPMSTITIIEDGLMIAMSAFMIINMI